MCGYAMKIYFEDGPLLTRKILHPYYYIIDASFGYNYTHHELELIQKLEEKREAHIIVYTNAPIAFSNIYAWDEEAQVPQIYIRNKEGIFTRIDEMTNRELKQGHNLWRLYEANEFGNL
jgi:hypothetical protein